MKTLQQRKHGYLGRLLVLLLALSGALMACRENALNDLSPQDRLVYITNYDRSVNFSQYPTFSLADSVVVQQNDRVTTSQNEIDRRFISNVAAALTSRGFRRVAQGQPADLGVAIIRVNNRFTGVGVNPNAYFSNYWFGGGFGGLGGWGFDPFFPPYYTYQVSDRYWEIQLVDLKNRPAPNGNNPVQLNVLFDATIRGADITDTQSVDTATTAIFNQAPYLRTN
ncbi:DUF4136 domain-containing protein [Spirosoma montaniterrae]|uniref:DUF4136 domain-containing protein n=1 Tax=Spirosoma montaniterrae TaxID=1178516 RepID=A0A1P9WR99_9BACT|nr:DUF4136 domain-containing protein [Spirosoma montaniterrae]AQG77896.1 hypothetical protein AWR27_00115 [Spirosoma montaniterrae]